MISGMGNGLQAEAAGETAAVVRGDGEDGIRAAEVTEPDAA